MRYRIEISKKARDQLSALAKEHRRNIGFRLEAMRDDLKGDVLKLQAKGNQYPHFNRLPPLIASPAVAGAETSKAKMQSPAKAGIKEAYE